MIAIPYDDLAEQPEQTIMLIKMLLAPFSAAIDSSDGKYTKLERDVLLVASRCDKPLRPIDLLEVLGIGRRTAVATLKSLCSKGRFRPIPGKYGKRIRHYAFIPSSTDHWGLF
ncbi:hypothetical protein [Paenibacillus kobensis]|uniref:hypothetical protein n=1 Tax=Paenibacillus kobensis TaxID=59841 RepID=UPI000FDA7015|nr:hypothetical protein [Paenibacillus kobensis]